MWAFDELNINIILFLLLLDVLAIMFVVVEQCMWVWHPGRRASMVDDVESIDRRPMREHPNCVLDKIVTFLYQFLRTIKIKIDRKLFSLS